MESNKRDIITKGFPKREVEDEPESIEVMVVFYEEEEHFKGYYDYDEQHWYVHLGGITVGHRKIDDSNDIEGWYYIVPTPPVPVLDVKDNQGSYYYQLFKFLNDEHNLILLDSEIQEIIYQVEKFQKENDVKGVVKDGWIRVEDEMPPPEKWVEDLENTPYMTYPHYMICRFYDGHFWKYKDAWDRDYKVFPTHWQPLPEKPTQ